MTVPGSWSQLVWEYGDGSELSNCLCWSSLIATPWFVNVRIRLVDRVSPVRRQANDEKNKMFESESLSGEEW